jgi:hypothetical protein
MSICPCVKDGEHLAGFPWKSILKFVVDFQFGYIPEDLLALGCLRDTLVAECRSEREIFVIFTFMVPCIIIHKIE